MCPCRAWRVLLLDNFWYSCLCSTIRTSVPDGEVFLRVKEQERVTLRYNWAPRRKLGLFIHQECAYGCDRNADDALLWSRDEPGHDGDGPRVGVVCLMFLS